MPKVPVYDTFQNASAPLPDVRQRDAGSADFAAVAAQRGKQLQSMGGDLMQIAVKEQEEVDQARLQEQYTKLSKAANASLYADGGVMGLQGSQAVGAADKWASDYDKVANDLVAELHPRQAAKFQNIVQATKRAYHDNVLRHEFRQAQAYKDETGKAAIDQALENAGANYQDGETVGLQIGLARGVMLERPEYKGASPEVRMRMDAALEGSFHARVVQSALDGGNTSYAKEWFDANKDRIPLDMRGKVERQIKPATDFAEGKGLALEAQRKISAGESIVGVESWLGEKAKSKEAHTIAQSMMAQWQDAQRRQEAHQQGGYLERFELAPSHKTFAAIMGDRGFQSMEPEARGKLVKYMRAELEQASDRSRVRRNEEYRTPETFDKFMRVLDSPDFAQKSREELFALRPMLGPELTSKLLAEHRDAANKAKGAANESRRFQIDKDLIAEAMPKSLLAPQYKDKANAYRGIVETELIQWKAQNPGKLPTLDEQKAIVRRANTEYTVVGGGWFGGDATVKAYELKPMPDDFRQQAIAARRARGLPSAESDLLRLWAQQKGSR